MRNTLIAIVLALLPVSIAAAEANGAKKPENPADTGRLLPLKRAAAGNSCAAYGAGFTKVEGTETCVKIGGVIRLDAGRSSGHR
jgi:hypothetical protein